MKISPEGAIGIFDSGVGGLSVWREITQSLPYENTVYFADQLHIPYGSKTKKDLIHFSHKITEFLLSQNCKAIVIACNSASAAALRLLRNMYPQVPFIGMEPAVKPAASMTKVGTVGVLATHTTLQGHLYRSTVKKHAARIRLVEQACHGLAECIDNGIIEGVDIENLLNTYLNPIMEAKADTLVLACTHYPFAINTIRRIVGEKVNIIDPSPAIARHLQDVLHEQNLSTLIKRQGTSNFFTTGSVHEFEKFLQSVLKIDSRGRTSQLHWPSLKI